MDEGLLVLSGAALQRGFFVSHATDANAAWTPRARSRFVRLLVGDGWPPAPCCRAVGRLVAHCDMTDDRPRSVCAAMLGRCDRRRSSRYPRQRCNSAWQRPLSRWGPLHVATAEALVPSKLSGGEPLPATQRVRWLILVEIAEAIIESTLKPRRLLWALPTRVV